MIGIGHWRYRRFHVSYLFGWLALGILLGLFFGQTVRIETDWLMVIVVIAILVPAFRSRRWWTAGMALIAGAIIGLGRGTDYSQQVFGYSDYVGSSVVISGVISSDPQDSGRGSQVFQLNEVSTDGVRLPGEVYVSTVSKNTIKRGDTVQVTGKLKEGFATYHATMSFATIGSVSRGSNAIRDLRENFSKSVRQFVVEPMASLGIGFVVGQRSSLPPELDEQLRIVGLTHIVVASGYNLTILVRFARRLLAKHSRYLAFVLSILLMLTFVAFSGLSPSMNRAVVVTGLSLLAWFYGRRFHPLLLIGYVAAGTALWNPVYVWADLGWYLSFFAFGGVLIVAPLIVALLFGKKKAPALGQLVIETLSAELMTLPLIALAFGTFPSFGLLANVLVGPIIPFAMLATTVAGLVGMVAPILAPIFAMPASIIIGYVVAVVEGLSGIEWAQQDLSLTMPLVCLWFAAVMTCSVWIWRRRQYNFRSSAITD